MRPGRIDFYRQILPDIVQIHDRYEGDNTSMITIKEAIAYQVGHELDAIQMEDDIVLTSDFIKKVQFEIQKRPSELIQFFSMRKDDLSIGSRYIPGGQYLMNQCFYLPLHIAKIILNEFDNFQQSRTDNNIGGTDSLIQYTLKKHKIRYWNVVPNLVDHIVGVSAIDKRRSSKRQSLTFIP